MSTSHLARGRSAADRPELELPAPDDAMQILETLATGVFPDGLGELIQLSWEPTIEPPSVPLRAIAPGTAEVHRADDARLRAAELRYRTLVEQIPAVTFMAVLGEGRNEVYVSPHIESLLGFTQKEWLEDPFLWYSQIHPEDRGLWIEEFARGIRTGGPFQAECRLLARDGRVVWVRGEARLMKDEIGRPQFLQGVAFDITEAKRAQEQLVRQAISRTEARYRDLVEKLGAIFWEAEARTGRFTFVSRGAERILGFPHEWWIQDPQFWISRIHPEDRDAALSAWRFALEDGRDREFEFRALTADDRVVWLHDSVHFSANAVGEVRPLGVILDITERKRAEQQLAESFQAANMAREAAELANRVKDEFLATMSHELRTPVNAVLGWSEVLEVGAGGAEMQERALVAIRRAARAQSQMIEDLLDVSRIVTGKFHLEIRRVDLAGIIEGALETVKLAADARQIHVSTRFEQRAAFVLGDAGRLRQVVSNLLVNAVKFTPHRGRIEVSLSTTGGLATIRVTDSGEGIAPEFLPYVFDRFRQSDSSATRTHGGLGLGLAIVRHLSELHGGAVRAESSGLGLGATFIVELPLDPDDESLGALTTGEGGMLAGTDGIGYLRDARVLVVDDDPASPELLVPFLARAGAEVTSASSAADARHLLGRRTFDLLIASLGLAPNDDVDLISFLRAQRGPNARIPAARLTASTRMDDQQRALAAGFQAQIHKPVNIEMALSVVGRLLHDARAAAMER